MKLLLKIVFYFSQFVGLYSLLSGVLAENTSSPMKDTSQLKVTTQSYDNIPDQCTEMSSDSSSVLVTGPSDPIQYSCTCYGTAKYQVCPLFSILTGIEYLWVDNSTQSRNTRALQRGPHCTSTLQFTVPSILKEGTVHVDIRCYSSVYSLLGGTANLVIKSNGASQISIREGFIITIALGVIFQAFY